MAVTVASVLTNVTTILNDAGMTRWVLSELLAWGSEGQVELVKIKPDAKLVIADLQLAAGARQKCPDDCVDLTDVISNADGSIVTPCDQETLNRFMPNWMRRLTGTKVAHWMKDANPGYFYVYPAQSVAAPGLVTVSYAAKPLPLVANGRIDVRDIYAANLENYILFRAYSKDAEDAGNAAIAEAYYQAFTQ